MISLILLFKSAIFDAINTVYNAIGICGIVVIILLGVNFWQYTTNTTQQIQILQLVSQNAVLVQSISGQNASIEAVGKERDALQQHLNEAANQNIDIASKYDILLADISVQPVAQTCDGALNEIRNSAAEAAKQWNEK